MSWQDQHVNMPKMEHFKPLTGCLKNSVHTLYDVFATVTDTSFSVHSWSCWICTSSVPSPAPAAVNPQLKAYRRHSALPQGNHRTATLPTKHKHLFMSSHPQRPKTKVLTLCLHSHIRFALTPHTQVHTVLVHFLSHSKMGVVVQKRRVL